MAKLTMIDLRRDGGWGVLVLLVIAVVLGLSTALPAAQAASATNYYVDANNGSDSNPGTSEDEPWKTLAPVHARDFLPGDVVHFRSGSSWSGGLVIDDSGVQGNPIVFRAYGAGERPLFANPGVEWGRAVTVDADWVVVDGLLVRDAHEAGVYILNGSDNNEVRDVEATNVGIGIKVRGQHNLITRNYVHDLKMVVNTPGGDDDYGAVGVWLYSSHNEVSHNRMVNCIAPSHDYGVDGRAVEWFDDAEANYIHHNWATGCCGIIEAGGGSCNDTVVAYNVFVDNKVDNGTLITLHDGSHNFRFEYNVVVETSDAQGWAVLDPNGSLSASDFLMRNNIFHLYRYTQVSTESGFTHDHNLYYLRDISDGIGYTLDETEPEDDPLFVDLENGDFHLRSGSLAIEGGVELGYSVDFDEQPVPVGKAPDMGAFEYRAELPPDTATPMPTYTATAGPPTTIPTQTPEPPATTLTPSPTPSPASEPPTPTVTPLPTYDPTARLSINDGAEYANQLTVTLGMEPPAGAVTMEVSNDPRFSPALVLPLSHTASWVLEQGGTDDLRTVYVRFRDGDGRLSASYEDSIILDVHPPTGSISVSPQGQGTVLLHLPASDDLSGVHQMRLSLGQKPEQDVWVDYQPTYELPDDGEATFTVQYLDNAGNVSDAYRGINPSQLAFKAYLPIYLSFRK